MEKETVLKEVALDMLREANAACLAAEQQLRELKAAVSHLVLEMETGEDAMGKPIFAKVKDLVD